MGRDRRAGDREFGDWLAVRWPTLVRTLLLLGLPRSEARAVAFATTVAVRPEWARLWEEEDLETSVHVALHDELARHRRRRADQRWVAPEPDPDADVEAAERLSELVAVLGSLAPDRREVLVLHQVAGLAHDQVAEVLGREPEVVPELPGADVRLALTALGVEPVTSDEVGEAVRERRARAVRRGVGVALVLALVLGGAGWWYWSATDRPGEVQLAENPLPLAWYADGLLHLDDVTVTVRPVVDLVTVPGGVVLADDRGGVVLARGGGALVPLGSTVPGQGLAVEPDNGWVAWADPGAGRPEVVVYDTRLGEEVGRRSLASPGEGGGQPVAGSGPVAIDGDRVYYAARGNSYEWRPTLGLASSISTRLADAADGASIARISGGFVLHGHPFAGPRRVSGEEARLTPDGRYLFVVDERGDLSVLDARTGASLDRLYSPSDRAVGWSYLDGTFWFAVVHRLQDKTYQDMLQMPSEGDYRIYECVPARADVCVERVRVREDAPGPPVLAR